MDTDSRTLNRIRIRITRVTVKSNMQKRQIKLKGLQASIVLTLKDKNKNIVEKKEIPANSFVLNFMKLLYGLLTASPYNVVDVNGNTVSAWLKRLEQTFHEIIEGREIEYDRYLAGYQAWCPKEDDTHGILIGTGTKTIDPNDYNLDSKIPNGTDSGQMLYLSSEVGDTIVAGNRISCKDILYNNRCPHNERPSSTN